MSLDLHDLRAKITPRTHAWLEARHRVTVPGFERVGTRGDRDNSHLFGYRKR